MDGDTNWVSDVFVHDRQTGETARASVDDAGNQGNSLSQFPRISAGGRFVAFESLASNLVPGDTNGALDVFVHDRQTRRTTRVSLSDGGAEGNSASGVPCLSEGGRFVAFESLASNLVPGDSNESTDVFVHDRQTGETTRVSVDSLGHQADGPSAGSSIDGRGRYVAFESLASNLVDGDTNRVSDVFVHDRQTGKTTRVSVDSRGRQANGGSAAPSLSGDGRFVGFGSYASNLVDGDTNQDIDVFVHDRQTGKTIRVSVDSQGRQANGGSGIPAVSAEGRWVAFHSFASNLVDGDTNGSLDIFVNDRETGSTTRISLTGRGLETNGPSRDSTVSGDGRFVAFESEASNLVARDNNGTVDVFVRDRGPNDPSAALREEKKTGPGDGLLAVRGESPASTETVPAPAGQGAIRVHTVSMCPNRNAVRRDAGTVECRDDFCHGLLGRLRPGLYELASGFRTRAKAFACGWFRVPSAVLASAEPASVQFTDVTEEAGIQFRHFKGETGKRYLPETMGSGMAVLDFDQDGWMDLFFVNGWRLELGRPEGAGSILYRNRGDGTFGDVTREAGLGFHSYGMGAAAGDYDNDGFPDLYVTNLGLNRLYRNNGDGTFSDVTVEAGVGDPSWGRQRGLAGCGQRREPRPLRHQLRPLEPLPGSVVRLQPRVQALLHSGDLLRRHLAPFPQPGRRPFPGRHHGIGTVQSVRQGVGSGPLGFRRERTDGSGGGRGHSARQDLSEPGRVPLRGGGDPQRIRLFRIGPSPGRHGGRRGRRRQRWPRGGGRHQLLLRRDRLLPLGQRA